jgi:hypothetical protein
MFVVEFNPSVFMAFWTVALTLLQAEHPLSEMIVTISVLDFRFFSDFGIIAYT